MAEARYLPEDLWPEILPSLPVKSLLRFRSVSKSWRALIDHPDFARSHLNRFNNRHESHLIVVQGTETEKNCVVRCTKTFSITQTLSSLKTHSMSTGIVQNWDVICSIDGLFMLKEDNSKPTTELMLWNPSIRKARTLPPPPPIPYEMTHFDFGLGFDPLTKDYKHVQLVGKDRTCLLHSIAIYTVGTNSWKTIQFQGKQCSNWSWYVSSHLPLRTVYLRGVLYVLKVNIILSFSELVSFDLSTEVFASTKSPVPFDPTSHGYLYYEEELMLADGGRKLALGCFSATKVSLWVLESSGDNIESMWWTKRYTFSTQIAELNTYSMRLGDYVWGSSKFLYLAKNDVMFLNWMRMVTSYNLRTREENIVLRKDSATMDSDLGVFRVCGYIESLILHK